MRPLRLILGALLAAGSISAAEPEVRLPQKHLTLLQEYCFDCHDSDTQKGKVNLEALQLEITTIAQAELWQKVLNAMNSGEMPPEDKRQPKSAEKADFLDALARTMVAARNRLSDTGGKITMRRLNRREYRNSIKYLTGVTPNVSSLPSDAGSGTFDTVGASQFISSDQFEQYLKIGRAAIDEVFERQAAQKQPSRVFRVEPEKTVNVENLEIIKRLEDTYKKKWLPWKEGVDKAAEAAENQEIVAALRKQHPDYDSNPTLKYKKADLLKGAPDPRDYGGSDPINAVAALYSPYQRYHGYMKHYAGLPHNDRGAYLKLSRGIQRFDVRPDPKDVPSGTYKLRIRAGAVKGSDPSRHFIEIGHPQKLNGTSPGFAKLLSTQPVSGTIENPEIIEVDVEIGASTPRVVGIQERQPKSGKLLREEFDRHKQKNGYGTPPAIWVDWIELEGPIQKDETPESKIVRIEPEQTINPANEKEIAEIEDSYARFTRWQKGVDAAAKTPANQAKIAEIRKTEPRIDHPFLFYAFADRLEGAPDAKDFGFRDSNKAASAHPERDRGNLAYHKHYAALPHRDRGAYLKLAYGTGWVLVAPKELPPGNYVMRVRVGAVKDAPAARRFIQVGHPQRLVPRNRGLAGRAISTHQVAGTIENPETIEIPLTVGADTPKEFAIQEKQPNTGNLKELWGAHNKWKAKNGYGHPPAIWIDWVELEGPLPKVEIAQSRIVRVEPENTINPKNDRAIKELEETFERFARWKKGVDEAAKTPENQAIIAEIAKKEKHILHPLRFYRYADRLKGTPDARDFGFEEAHAPTTANPEWPNLYAYLKHYASLPHRDTGAYLKPTKGTGRVIVSPEKLPLGNYTLRVRVGVVEGSDPSRHFIQVGHPQRQYTAAKWDHGLEGRAISTHQVSGTVEKPEVIEIPLKVGSDTLREFAVQEKQPNNGKMQALWQTFNEFKKKNGYGIPPAIWIDWVELEGPHDPASHKTWKQRREVEHHANAKVGGTYNGYFKGGYEKAQAFLKTGQPQKGIVDEQEANFRIRAYEQNGPSYRRYLEHPLTQTGSLLTISSVNKGEFIALPPEQPSGWHKTKHVVESLPAGDYKLRFRIGAVTGTPTERHFVDLGLVPAKDQFSHLATFQITGSTSEPQIIEVPVQLTKDGPRKFELREKRDPQNDQKRYQAARKETGLGPTPALWIDWVEWEGPFPQSSSETGLAHILAKHTGDGTETVRHILNDFSVHAFRGVRPDPKFIDQLLAIYQTRREAGDTHDLAIRLPLSVILASPGFLYLNEPGNEKARRALTDRELAVRLAYFLWSAPPDQELLALAAKDQLHEPQVLRQQVDRLIADPRSDEFVSGFVHQWLDMERLDFFQFDTTLHREFDESTRAASRREVYESFAHLLRSTTGGAIGKLLKSDYVFINGLLATYYGIDGISGDEFRKVSLPANSPRGGLLGMAAIHAMGSDGVASSPVERGAWVLRHLLHDPPPPAPPNVPQLSRLAGKPLSTREKLAAHQEEPQCASCHRKIDPIGFGLENFNAAGKWRVEEFQYTKTRRGYALSKTGTPIDTSGQFHNGPTFANYEELRNLIAQREPDFARGFTEHLIEYGLGRPYGFTDENLASEIMTAAKKNKFAVSEFIQALVLSEAFKTK